MPVLISNLPRMTKEEVVCMCAHIWNSSFFSQFRLVQSEQFLWGDSWDSLYVLTLKDGVIFESGYWDYPVYILKIDIY